MRTLDGADRPPSLLTSRRHIDFGRTSSAVCPLVRRLVRPPVRQLV
ncbi:hypothetical protein SALBM135S_02323 [Streptomyces alboniger]